ncbi:MAG: glycosyltransferase [Azoarcus sp.]|jgi:GT2 family glycosyltransferase|nr:glycosyltransferase [Azoarcus sp.]
MPFWQEEETETVDIIVPVHGGKEVTRRCLASLYACNCRTAREIVVIDDASPDPTLSAWLGEEAVSGCITLLRNEENRGFVASVNNGMALHPERDVVLLNSDTEVAGDWLDRLRACALAQPDIGTVTPFSNNATICSYPFEGWAEGVPGTLGLAALDALFANINGGEWIELPTAVGFCMLIRRACLDAVGFFDAERFGRGYGEENDFSRRATAVGWRNALAADVFVYHVGGVSFGNPAKHEAMERAAHILAALHPDYDEKVRDFIRRDPPAPLRARIDRARAALGGAEFAAVMDERARMRAIRVPETCASLRSPLPTVLHVMHNWGGGIDRWVRDYCEADLDCRNLVLRGRTSRNGAVAELDLVDHRFRQAPLMSWTLTAPIFGTAIDHAEYAAIVRWICAAFEVRAVLVSSLIGHALELLRLDIPLVLIAHDLYPFCPALFAAFDAPCTRCGDDELERCLRENSHNAFWHIADVRYWQALRAAFAARLTADNIHVVAPGKDVHARWATLFPSFAIRPWTCIPHGLGAALARGPAMPAARANLGFVTPASELPRLRVLIPGRLLPHKGLWLWRQIYEELRAFADVLLLGCGDFGLPFAGCAGVEVEPEYAIEELPKRVARWQPDCALLLSILPESFGYTLAEMQALAVPVLATRIGAYAERINEGWNGFLVEAEASAVLEKLRALSRARDRLDAVADILRFSPVRTAFDMVADYRRLLPDLGAGGASSGAETLLATLAERLRVQEESAHLRARVQARDDEAEARALNQRRLESMVEALARQHAAILHSTSWRISAPVRVLGRLWTSLRGQFPSSEEKPQVVRTRVERRKKPRPPAPVPPLLRSRAAARYWLCEAIGVPDGVVIIAGGGSEPPPRAQENFIALADAVTRRSTRACFVWCGGQESLAASDVLALRLLREVRDLFVLDKRLEAEVFAGADVLLLPTRDESGNDKGTVAGIPRVALPLGQYAAGISGVMTATITQLLQYCDNATESEARPL